MAVRRRENWQTIRMCPPFARAVDPPLNRLPPWPLGPSRIARRKHFDRVESRIRRETRCVVIGPALIEIADAGGLPHCWIGRAGMRYSNLPEKRYRSNIRW